ncbi:Cof-type HAD-IIB family hydrolase [Endozoicomonas sp. Mp262]|uniref:Cof-type HAD-IIB family hydrolase n=1 Tax=Endozoicomonas sp. Mp262 TaxID=2919499 RepID=UPI0021DA2CF3
MYPVVVSDLDGTLLNDSHELSDRSREIIQNLSAKGIKFIFATGRHYLDVDQIRAQLGIDMYLITSNGARVHSPGGEEIIRHDIFPEYVNPLIELGRKYQQSVFTSVYQGSHWYVEQEHEKLLEYHKDSGFSYTHCDLDGIETTGVQKIFFNTESHEDLLPLAEETMTLYGDKLSMTYSLPTCFEVMAPGVCKGVALAEVLKLKGYEFRDAIAFGDGLNDFEMLQEVGKGILMGGADKKLRAKLPDNEVIGLANDNAVAEYLNNLYN